ncbi:MAG TPA: alpha/beta fold hydrolase [Gemmatimonadaceae bacterium]|nr:alpha/beta fold hydrolase [Gemmatimonadaceae bacterium]
MSGWLWWVALAAVWWVVRDAIGRREERRVNAKYERDADGIIKGAHPIRHVGPRAGAVLLLHGYNDSPQAVATLAATLHARGWSVRAPLLPGHGRTLQAFAASGARAWMDAARQEFAALRATHDEVAVGGLSMGGAMALVLAGEHPEIRAVVAFAPYLHVSRPVRALELAAPVAALGARYVWGGAKRSVHDRAAAARMIAYGRSTPRLLAQLDRIVRLAHATLPRVVQPVLVIQSREDNRIPVKSAEEAFAKVGAADKTLHWTTGNGHVVTVDYGHEALERLAADWLETRLA